MDINLGLPSEEHDKEETQSNGVDNLLDYEEKLHDVDGVGEDLEDFEEKIHVEDEGDSYSPENSDVGEFTVGVNLEPLAGMEFESQVQAYACYQEYARSLGFTTAIQNSRRSKTSREFIDAKFACSRYGTKREYEKSANRPRSRQGSSSSNQDPENATGRRACAKTDCKASMHVKRRPDGKWLIHRFEKEHNHELSPAQAVSEQTGRMYAAMARQFAEYKNVVGLKSDSSGSFERVQNSAMEAGEANILLEFFVQMQSMNSNFFYAVEVSEDQRLKNFLWVDAKSRHDYAFLSDVVCFDTTYVRNKYKMPIALFIGVNHHYQFMLLGIALLSDESSATLSWVMRTWLRAMGGQAPKVIITDQEQVMKSVISEIFPSSLHFFFLWHVLGKVSESLKNVIKENDEFMVKFEECIYRPWTDGDFEKNWKNLLDMFEVGENELLLSLYEDRMKWVPALMRNACLAGMSTAVRSESVNSFFDKYVHKKTTLQEFVKQYEAILQDRYEEEAKSDYDTWNKELLLKTPSPFEKHAAGVYTHAVFKKFQIEVLGAVACIPKLHKQDETKITFITQDCEKDQEFMVTLNEVKLDISCTCHLFELKGYLCRHAMVVLQLRSISTIPHQHILKRWTKDPKSRYPLLAGIGEKQSRVQRYNDLFQRVMILIEEGSLTQESYTFVFRALDEAFGNCVNGNNSNKNTVDDVPSSTSGLLFVEDNQTSNSSNKTNKKKNNPTEKRKANSEPNVTNVGAPANFEQLDKSTSRQVTLDGYYPQQCVQLTLMAPTRDNYYGNQQTMQGLGQLNSIAPTPDGYYGTHSTIHELGHMDFFRTPSFPYGIREVPNVRSAQLHDEASRRA